MKHDLNTKPGNPSLLTACQFVFVHYFVAGLVPVIFLVMFLRLLGLANVNHITRLVSSLLILIVFDWIFVQVSLRMLLRTSAIQDSLSLVLLSGILLGATLFLATMSGVEYLHYTLPEYARTPDFHFDIVPPLKAIIAIIVPFLSISVIQMRGLLPKAKG